MTVWDDDAQDPFDRPQARAGSRGRDAAATALVVVGIVGVLAWVWLTYRTQVRGSLYPGFDDTTGIALAVRLDLFASSVLQLVMPVGAIAAGRYLQRKS